MPVVMVDLEVMAEWEALAVKEFEVA